MRRRDLLGPWGEALACEYLRGRGCRIVACNYRSRFGEIDLVAARGAYLVFVEVKLRRDDRYGSAAAFVDARKQQRIRSTALFWLQTHPDERQPRFDVVEVYAPEGLETRRPRIHHMENAFE